MTVRSSDHPADIPGRPAFSTVGASAAMPLRVDEFRPQRRSLRIAIVTETYPPEVNGVATTIACFVRGLIAQGHAVQLVRPRQSQTSPLTEETGTLATEGASAPVPPEEILLRGLPIPRYPELRMGLPAKRPLVQLWSLQRPDVVHIVTEGPLGWSAMRAARHLKLPMTSDFRTNFHAYSRHYGIGWLHKSIFAYLRKFHNATQCTMVPTEGLRRDLEASGFQHVEVVARGVDTQLFNPARRSAELRRQWNADDATPVALCVGRLAPEKNLGVAVSAFEAMREAAPNAKLVFVGDGPARQALAQRCPGAIFCGQQTGERLAEHYASADVFLFPSITETFGNVTPEAMASGLAVVAYQYAAAGQLIRHGENGLLAPLDNAPAFAQAARLAADVAAARRMGAVARATACEHEWDRVVARLAQVFENAVSGNLPALRGARLRGQQVVGA